MPFPVQELIEGRITPITVSPNCSVEKALELMITSNYSQMPIVDDDKRVHGMVTSDEILRALYVTKMTTSALHFTHLDVRYVKCQPDEDIFEVIERMRNFYACLVVDNNERLMNIITDFDTSEYFRRRAANIMLVEDIEQTLKSFILFAFPSTSDQSQITGLDEAVKKVLAPPHGFEDFKKALGTYIQKVVPDKQKLNHPYADMASDFL